MMESGSLRALKSLWDSLDHPAAEGWGVSCNWPKLWCTKFSLSFSSSPSRLIVRHHHYLGGSQEEGRREQWAERSSRRQTLPLVATRSAQALIYCPAVWFHSNGHSEVWAQTQNFSLDEHWSLEKLLFLWYWGITFYPLVILFLLSQYKGPTTFPASNWTSIVWWKGKEISSEECKRGHVAAWRLALVLLLFN